MNRTNVAQVDSNSNNSTRIIGLVKRPIDVIMRGFGEAEYALTNTLVKEITEPEVICCMSNFYRVYFLQREKINKKDREALEQVLMVQLNAEFIGFVKERTKKIQASMFRLLCSIFKHIPEEHWIKELSIIKDIMRMYDNKLIDLNLPMVNGYIIFP